MVGPLLLPVESWGVGGMISVLFSVVLSYVRLLVSVVDLFSKIFLKRFDNQTMKPNVWVEGFLSFKRINVNFEGLVCMVLVN